MSRFILGKFGFLFGDHIGARIYDLTGYSKGKLKRTRFQRAKDQFSVKSWLATAAWPRLLQS
jgi:hypothetical protein